MVEYEDPFVEGGKIPRTLNICPICSNTVLYAIKTAGDPVEMTDELYCESCGWEGLVYMTETVPIN